MKLLAIFVVVFGLTWSWYSRPQNPTVPSPNPPSARIGGQAPNLDLPMLNGKRIALAELRGKSVVLNFWATWCPPCRAEMAALNHVHRDLAERGVVVLGVNQMEESTDVQRYMQAQGLDFPIALDLDGAASRQYRVSALPTTYFIDHAGVIRDVVFGGPMAQALIESKALALLALGR
jgi:peroxiredoxin